MLFNSIHFLAFFPIVVLLYYCIPDRLRNFWLLVCSYYFYMSWNAEYAVLLLGSTIITYIGGLLIQKYRGHGAGAKAAVAASFVLNLSMLAFFKYSGFLLSNLSKVLGMINIRMQAPKFDLLLPVGISFYIFQALGYTMDVYRGKIGAERNFLRYAVFVSFFPQLVAGPIERADNLLGQFRTQHRFRPEKVKDNLLLMAWGYFMKMVIADRIAIFVDAVYGDYDHYGGWYIVTATVLFAFQVYCDFAGYSTIAAGAAGVMGFDLMDNFRSPYCAVSIKDFWSRWHISLTSWFKDYLYIPLGGNRCGRLRQYLNQMIVFLISGLWHGAQWSYVVWGGINGLFLVTGEIIAPFKKRLKKLIGWKEEALSNRVLEAAVTFVLVDFTWIFFRAGGGRDAVQMLGSILRADNFQIFLNHSLYKLGLDQRNFILLLLSIILLITVDVLHNRQIRVREWLKKQNLWFRWLIYILLFESILVFGIWGVGYDKTAFLYFQF